MKELTGVSTLPPVLLFLLDTVILAWLIMQQRRAGQSDASTCLVVPLSVMDNRGVWVLSLKQILPNTWRTKGLASLAAAKDDNAPVEFDL